MTLALWISAGVFVALFCFLSFFRGWKRALLRFFFLAAALFAAVLAARPLARPVAARLLPLVPLSLPEDLTPFLSELLAAASAPALFTLLVLLFFLLSLLFYLPFAARIRKKEKDPAPVASRIIGLCLGFLSSVLTVAALFLSFYGYPAVFRRIGENGEVPRPGRAVSLLGERADAAIDSLGAYRLFAPLTRGSADGETFYLADREELSVISALFEAKDLIRKDPARWDGGDAAVIRRVTGELSASAVGRIAGIRAARSLGSAWSRGETWAGIRLPEGDAVPPVLRDALLKLLRGADSGNVRELYRTGGELLAVLAERGRAGLLSGSGEIGDLLADRETFAALLDPLFAARSFDGVTAAAASAVIDRVMTALNFSERASSLYPDPAVLSSAPPAQLEKEKEILADSAADAALLRDADFSGRIDLLGDKEALLACARILDRTKGTLLFSRAADGMVELLLDSCCGSGLLGTQMKEALLRRWRNAGADGFSLERALDLTLTAAEDLRALGRELLPDEFPEPREFAGSLGELLESIRGLLGIG